MIPRRPQPLAANPEPLIPAPKRHSTALRISYGGCEWCGGAQRSGGTACLKCSVREQTHRERMIELAEQEAELRNQLLTQQLMPVDDDTKED